MTGVVAAALLASTAAAQSGRSAAESYIELCGPSGCARTTDPAGLAQFRDFVGPLETSKQIPGFPPPVQQYWRVKSNYLHRPAVFVANGGEIGLKLTQDAMNFTSLGTYTISALTPLTKKVKPFAAPTPRQVKINNKVVKARPIYRHLLDNFREAYNVQQSSKPWIGVSVAWAAGCPWPKMSFTVRKGSRLMLRNDHAVTISKELAAQIQADAKKLK